MLDRNQLLIKVWQAVSAWGGLEQTISTITEELCRLVTPSMIVVRRIDVAHLCLETVAVGTPAGAAPPGPKRTPKTPAELQQLLAWCRLGQVLRVGDDDSSGLLDIAPSGMGGSFLVGPLYADDGPAGVLMLVPEVARALGDEAVALLEALLKPVSVALNNDKYLRDLESHHKSAEADRASLLTKLGRADITESIVGADSGLRDVLERVELVARSGVAVLLLGETGSGKEVIARAIHNRSERSDGPFLRVNCGAIPPELIDSELFGHERGSFTGAVSGRKGWFERSDGGTLFMDEVAELPPGAQVRLLRVLQDGMFERVGGQRGLAADVRVIAATNRNLEEMVGDGTFRADLWYRLAVFPIRLPSLRERPEDLPALATHFALRAARRFGLAVQVPTQEDLGHLASYDWPGNIRELASVIDRAAILGNGHCLSVRAALGEGWSGRADTSGDVLDESERSGGAKLVEVDTKGRGKWPSLEDVIRRHIEAALSECKGRIEGAKGAARLVEVNPHTLRSKIRKLGIDAKRFREGAGP